MASSTVHTPTLSKGFPPSLLDADTWIIKPAVRASTCFAIPLWYRTASTPPFTTWSTVFCIFSSPRTGPIETPWSMAIIKVLPSLRIILRNRLVLPDSICSPPTSIYYSRVIADHIHHSKVFVFKRVMVSHDLIHVMDRFRPQFH